MNRMQQDHSALYSTVYFYIREKLWATLQSYCDDHFNNLNDPFFAFWKAFSFFQEGNPNEAINTLTAIQQRKEIEYATIQALKFYHNKCDFVDSEAIQNLRYQEEESRKMSSDKAIVLTCYFFLYLKQDQKALDYLEMVNVQGVPSQTCEGWITLLHSEHPDPTKAFDIFKKIADSFNNTQVKPVETMMGLAQSAYLKKDLPSSSDTINELIVMQPDFQCALYVKALIQMMTAGWNDFIEIANKLLMDDSQNILALKCQTFYTIARQGDVEYGCEKLKDLTNTIFLKEPNNTHLMLSIAELFSRISGRNEKILKATMKLIEKCRELQPLNADFAIELANHYMMMEDFSQAYSLFQEAAALDESKMESLSGMILCKIYQGEIDDAEQQLIFIKEVQVSVGRTSTQAFLEGILTNKKKFSNPKEKEQNTMKFIDEALKMHIMSTKNLLSTFQFYIQLNPDFLLSLSQIYLQSVGMKQMLEGTEAQNHYVSKGTKLLETVLRQIPGYITGYLLTAKGKMAMGDINAASASINKVLEMDPQNEEAYILQALILTKSEKYVAASHSLKEAISNNFQIRDNPLFMLVKGEVEFAQKDYESSLATAEAAFDIPGVKNKNNQNNMMKKEKQSLLQFVDKDRCRIFLLLAKSYAANKKLKESKQVMAKAIGEWSGTEEEVNVLIANSEIAIQSGDIKKAISILRGVKSDSQYFQQSRILLAEVHLTHLKDRRQFAKCYTDLIEVNPSFENFKLLGDALLKIREPEEASKAFEQALQKKAGDESIIQSLGSAYCQTYNYEKAIAYYENELKTKQLLFLILDLGKLYIQIKNYQRAEELLKPQLFAPDDFKKQSIENLRNSVEGFLAIAKLNLNKMGKGNFQPNENVRKALKSAISVQKDVIERCKTEGGDIEAERLELADINIQLAEYTSNHEKNDEASLQSLEDAQKYLPSNEKIIELKAKIYFRMGDKVSCEQHCNMLTKINPNNDFASMMQAEILLQKDDYDQAITQFKNILEQNPTKYGILAKIIDFYRRTFNLKEAKKLIDKAEKLAINANDAGLCFCRGLYHKFNRSPKEALSEFSKSKKQTQYAEESLVNMIDIYLNPDQDLYYSCVEDAGLREVPSHNIKACESLLREMQLRSSYHRYVVMESYVLYMGKYQGGVEKAVTKLTGIVKQRQDYIPAMLALAIGKLIMKKQTDAKNLLKALWKKPYTTEHSEDLERAWLLHADSFVAIQKYDNAEEILKKCRKYNLSCGKAEEYMGLIKEKEHSYVDAAVHYEKAHQLSGEKSASVGFRLAFNYLKAKRYIDSINVCKSILKVFPDYPKIEKDVLLKARQALR